MDHFALGGIQMKEWGEDGKEEEEEEDGKEEAEPRSLSRCSGTP